MKRRHLALLAGCLGVVAYGVDPLTAESRAQFALETALSRVLPPEQFLVQVDATVGSRTERRPLETGYRIVGGLIGVVDGEHDGVGPDFQYRTGQRCRREDPAGGEDDIGAQVGRGRPLQPIVGRSSRIAGVQSAALERQELAHVS